MVKLTAYRWLLPAADFVNFFLFSQTSSAIIYYDSAQAVVECVQ